MSTFIIEKKLLIKASVESAFNALTSSEEIPKYFPLTSVESTWEVGGDVLYKGEISGTPFTDYGVIEKLIFPKEYQYRYWSDNHDTERTEENHLTITYRLDAADEGALLTVRQSNIKSREMYELMNGQVWEFLLSAFKEYIEALPANKAIR